ncbi:MAG: VanZ family protein [Acidobacteriota bacterium]
MTIIDPADAPTSRRALAPALAWALSIWATAPAIGKLRDLVFEHFAGGAVRLLAGGFIVALGLAFVFAVMRIRAQRALRYGGLALAALLVWLQLRGVRTASAQVNVVEQIHVLQYGLLAVLLYRAWRPRGGVESLLHPLLWTIAAGALDELVQWWSPRRVADGRDILLNAAAGGSGLVFALSLLGPPRFDRPAIAGTWTRIGYSAAIAVLAVGLTAGLSHLGYAVEDPAIGTFASHATRDELLHMQADRRRAWAIDPPDGRAIWSKQDYFLSEAARHANHRNASERAGNDALAWQANRILETYYDPFLDVDGYRGAGVHRWSDAHRAAVEMRADKVDPATYVSPVLRKQLWTDASHVDYWAGVLLIALTLAVMPGWEARRRARQRDTARQGDR